MREKIDLEHLRDGDRIDRRTLEPSVFPVMRRKGGKRRVRRITVEGGKLRRTCSQKPGSRARREREENERQRERERETMRSRERKDGKETEREGERSRSGSTRLAPP